MIFCLGFEFTAYVFLLPQWIHRHLLSVATNLVLPRDNVGGVVGQYLSEVHSLSVIPGF